MKSNYALGLVVGVKNQFTKGSKEIQEEYKKLSKSHTKLQENIKDVSAYEKTKAELKSYRQEMKKMSNPTEEAEMKLKALTGSLSSYSRRLKKAGVDTSDLAFEQEKLQKQLNRTTQAMNAAGKSTFVKHDQAAITEMATSAVSGLSVVGASAAKGIEVNKVERNAAASTKTSLDEVQSWRNDINKIEVETSRPYQEILNARIQAKQSGYDNAESQELAMTSSQLAAVFPQWQSSEIMQAQTRMMKSLDISATKAADLITIIAQKSGDDRNDLLDTLTEYMPLFSGKGLSAESVSAQFIAGKTSGAWNYDKMADSIKEMLQARLTDVDEFAKLVGSGKEQGTIDSLVKDEKTAYELKNAVFELRAALSSGENIDSSYSKVMMGLSGLYVTDKGAARNIAEGIIGNIGAEDLGNRTITAMATASADPHAILGEYIGGLNEAIDVAISPTQKMMASLSSLWRSASTFMVDIENNMEWATDRLSSGVSSLSEAANDNALVAGALVAAGTAASSYGAIKVYKKFKDVIPKSMSFLTDKDVPNQPTGGKFKGLVNGAGSAVSSLGKVIKPVGYVLGAASIASNVKDGDYRNATETAGGIAGGVAGAKFGATLGLVAGPWGVVAGGALGGIAGAVMGEEVVSSMMDYFSPSTDKEIKEATAQVTSGETELAKKTSLESQPLQIAISAPLTIESGAVVPDDFEERFNAMLRNATPAMVEQLRETMNNQIMV